MAATFLFLFRLLQNDAGTSRTLQTKGLWDECGSSLCTKLSRFEEIYIMQLATWNSVSVRDGQVTVESLVTHLLKPVTFISELLF